MPEPNHTETAKPQPAKLSPNMRSEWVDIPSHDAIGKPFPTLGINYEKYEPGQRYAVTPAVAETLNQRIAAYNNDIIRMLSGSMDKRVLMKLRQASMPNAEKYISQLVD